MSARPSVAGSAAACSGAMYAGVPSVVPSCVRPDLLMAVVDLRPSRLSAPGSVAMDDAALVRVGECARDVLENAHGAADRKTSLALDARAQRLAFNERHREV